MNRILRLALCLVPLLLLVAACDLLESPPGSADATPAPAATVSPAVAVPQPTAVLPVPPIVTVPAAPLRVWIPPEIGARTEEGAAELNSQIRAFQSLESGTGVVVEQKPVEGPGGIISYLQTGSSVAPDVMPDVVALPVSLLTEARIRQLFAPLDTLIEPAALEDIYPAPAGQTVADGRFYGVPFATSGLTHLIYQPRIVTETISLTWTRFISDTDHTLVLPADSREGAMLGLQFYLAEEGALVDESGRPALQPEPLARALAQIGLRKDNLLQSHQLKTLDEAWQYHRLGLSDFMWSRSDFQLGLLASGGSDVAELAYSPVPGSLGPLVPLTTSWAWAIAADDPTRQMLAADLIRFLTTPDNLANWSGRSTILPARRGAVALLSEDQAYYEFAGEEMERARPMPVNEAGRLMDVLGDAVYQVLTTETSPVLIAEQAATALRQ